MTTVTEDKNRKWWTLAAVSASLFMVMVDTTIVNVALPAIQLDLRIALTELEWTVNAFLLVYAAFLLTGGKLADLLGRKRLFLFGLAVFVLASVACGLAESGGMLIGARAVQGLGAALMLPATQGLIAANFEPRERGMAYGIWAAVSLFGLSIGPLIGGILIDGLDWRWIFYVNIPFGAVAFLFAAVVLRESKDTSENQRLDLPGLVTSGLALFALVFALVEGNRYGWTSPLVLSAFGVGAAAFVLFIVVEWRQRLPMLDLSLFRNRTFTGANVTGLLVMLALLGVLFFVSIYLQAVLGYSAIEAGAMFLPMTLLMMALSPVAGKLADGIGPRWPITAGMLLLALSLVLWSRLGLESGFWDMLPGLLIGGVALGLVMSPTTTAAIGSLPVGRAGVASGVVNTFRQTGGALGVAIMGAILASHLGDLAPGTREFAVAFIPGFEDALLLAALISLVGAVFGGLMIGKPEEERAAAIRDEPVPAAEAPITPPPVTAPLPEAPPVPAPAPAPAVSAPAVPVPHQPQPTLTPSTELALMAVVRSEMAPLVDRYDNLEELFQTLLMRLTSERRERIDDLELLTKLVMDGWRGVDRRLGRLEKTIARIDDAQRAAGNARGGGPTVVQFDKRWEGPAGNDSSPAAAEPAGPLETVRDSPHNGDDIA